MLVENSPLGKNIANHDQYAPQLLFPIARITKRQELGISTQLPFYGYDLWNHYEVSWLNLKGKPEVAMVELIYDCDSPNIIESKSMKLYFNSFNNTKIQDELTLKKMIETDLSAAVQGKVTINIKPLLFDNLQMAVDDAFICLDKLDVDCSLYQVENQLLTVNEDEVQEALFSNLLKSNCLVTNQPDWGSIFIRYKGKRINHESLLKYIISFRNHNEFHEQCVERIFMAIYLNCQPKELTIYARYTRRGGLDINPYRSTIKPTHYENFRLPRQ